MSDGDEHDDERGPPLPLGPATGAQVMAAIAVVFLIGVVIGFLLGRTF